MGLPGVRYDAVALELFRLTGGFSASLDAGGIAGRPGTYGQFMFFRTRCLRQNLPDAAAPRCTAAGLRGLQRRRRVSATSSSSCATT